MSEEEIRIKLLKRILDGADEKTSTSILLLGSEMTTFRLLVAVATIDAHLSRGLLVIRYGVTEDQARKARTEANRKLQET